MIYEGSTERPLEKQKHSIVTRVYKRTANLKDYMTVGKNVGRVGMLTGASINENEEQQR
jgi:hypothetical protein